MAFLLSFCLCFSGISLTVFAEGGYSYRVCSVNEDGTLTWETKTKPREECVLLTADTYKMTAEKWYVAEGNVEIHHRIECVGDVHLILTDGSSYRTQDIGVSENNSLTIYGQEEGTGRLYAKGEHSSPGIGGKAIHTQWASTPPKS